MHLYNKNILKYAQILVTSCRFMIFDIEVTNLAVFYRHFIYETTQIISEFQNGIKLQKKT